MKNLNTLLAKIKEKPQALPNVVNRLFGELGDSMKGVVEFEVPTKFAKIFDLFGKEDISEKEFENVQELFPKKGISIKSIAKDIKDAKEKKKVKLDLSKVKKVISGDIGKIADDKPDDDEMNESCSLLQEDATVALAAAYLVGGTAMILLSIAMIVYPIWILVRCIEHNTISVFEDENNVGGIVLSVVLILGSAGLLWAILMHIKLNKLDAKDKGSKKNEDAEDDSILAGMPMNEFATGEEALDSVGENDKELLNAYRIVLSDLKHRSPNGEVPDPLKESVDGKSEDKDDKDKDKEDKGEGLQESADPNDDSVFASMDDDPDKK